MNRPISTYNFTVPKPKDRRKMPRRPGGSGTRGYGKKRWRRDPDTRKRRYTKSAPDKVLERSRPDLRIIAPALWCAVEERRKAVYENYAGRSEGAPGRRTAHPFSGLLFCVGLWTSMVDGGSASAEAESPAGENPYKRNFYG